MKIIRRKKKEFVEQEHHLKIFKFLFYAFNLFNYVEYKVAVCIQSKHILLFQYDV